MHADVIDLMTGRKIASCCKLPTRASLLAQSRFEQTDNLQIQLNRLTKKVLKHTLCNVQFKMMGWNDQRSLNRKKPIPLNNSGVFCKHLAGLQLQVTTMQIWICVMYRQTSQYAVRDMGIAIGGWGDKGWFFKQSKQGSNILCTSPLTPLPVALRVILLL